MRPEPPPQPPSLLAHIVNRQLVQCKHAPMHGSARARSVCATQAPGACWPLPLPLPLPWQVALLEQLVDEVWSGPAVLVLNPGWSQSQSQGGGLAAVPKGYAALVDSFDVVYSFLPCAIQVRDGRAVGQ